MQAFANSRNVTIEQSTFSMVQHIYPSPAFKELRQNIADSAMHNSGERFDPPKCYPGTRELIIKQLLDWVIEHDRETFMRWLYGPAGAGKSAILQEVAEMCAARKLLVASFFFSRTAALRNDEKRLIATIAYQLARSIPPTRSFIEEAIGSDPAIFSMSLESQLLSLIIEPLNRAHTAVGTECTGGWPYLILIDGLDECSQMLVQQRMLTSLVTQAAQCKFPLIFLISSRPEVHIFSTFNRDTFKGRLIHTALDEDYRPEDDIRRFLEGTIEDLKNNHPLCAYIPPHWPLPEAMNTLIRKSSGQFIYAATAARYISPPDCHPIERLDIILGLAPVADRQSPFAELDALYSHILSLLPNEAVAKQILALLVYPRKKGLWTAHMLDSFLGLRVGSAQQILNGLASIITIEQAGYIQVLHASIADFVLDATRSSRFFIDMATQSLHFTQLCLRYFVSGKEEAVYQHALYNIANYCKNVTVFEELQRDFVDFDLTTMARVCLQYQGSTTDPYDGREDSLREVIRKYLACSSTIQAHFLNAGDLFYNKCRQAVRNFVESQISLHYRSTTPFLETLFVLYSVDPVLFFRQSICGISPKLNQISHYINIVDFILVPTNRHEFELFLEIDRSSLRLYTTTTQSFTSDPESTNDVYLSFCRELLTEEDIMKAAKHLVSHIQLPRFSITTEDRLRYSILDSDTNFELSQEETAENENSIWTLKDDAYTVALYHLTILLPDASADADLSNLLRSTNVQWKGLEPTTFKPRLEAEIDKYLVRSQTRSLKQISEINLEDVRWRNQQPGSQLPCTTIVQPSFMSTSREFPRFPVFRRSRPFKPPT